MIGATFKFIKKIDAERKVAEAFDDQIENLALMMEADIKEVTPVVTGRLRGSMTGERVGFLEGRVFSDVHYAEPVEYGTARFSGRAMFRRGARTFFPKGLAFLKNKLPK